MKAELCPNDFEPKNSLWVVERKYDGHRIMIHVLPNGSLDSWSSQLKPSNRKLHPRLQDLLINTFLPGVYDGELHTDKPNETSSDVALLANRDALKFTAFDMLGFYNRDITNQL